MCYQYYCGIDISKDTLDYCLYTNDKTIFCQGVITNTAEALNKFKKQLTKELRLKLTEILFCAEHTGSYGINLLNWVKAEQLNLWLESPLNLKRSIGLKRGKNDSIDARRIAYYAFIHKDEARLWQ